jgi:beta-galactosidase
MSSERKILFGGDYNPEQWLDRSGVLNDDISLMKQAGVTVVSLGIFAWSSLEPEEGRFSFGWMDEVIKRLHRAEIAIYLATPSGARPSWLAARYPEVLRVAPDGKRNLFGGRHNHCYTSPLYRKKTALINKKLSERYGSHPAVILWHISNEYGGECHCELCQANFRLWLKERYGSLEELNRAWWNSFWSHTISDWEEIHSPVPHGETGSHALVLDWKRFVSHMTVDFMRHEVKAVREGGSMLPVTTNMLPIVEKPGFSPGLDYWKFRDVVDIVSWDSYPAWHMPGFAYAGGTGPVDDYRRAAEEAFLHDLYRSLSGGPFILMESTPANVNWAERSKIKKPGMIRLSALNAVAHGANSVQYFQWRKSRGSFEKFHGAMVGHDGGADTRVFRESSELGALLGRMGSVAETVYPAKTAIIFNWENWWALDESRGQVNDQGKAYLETVKKHHFALWNLGIQTDILSGDEDALTLGQYKLIAAPMLYMLPLETASKLETFVVGGGTLLSTYQTGYADEHDLCYESFAPGPLSDLFGLEVEECDALYPGERVSIKDFASTVSDYQDIIREGCNAEVVSVFQGGMAHDRPAVTRNARGKGHAWYLAGRVDAEALERLYGSIIVETGLESSHKGIIRRGPAVSVKKRVSETGEEFIFLLNFSAEPSLVEFDRAGENGRKLVELPPYGAEIVRRDTV